MELKEVDEAGRLDRVELTFMFTDIVSSTTQLERIGSDAWFDVIVRLRETLSFVAQDFRGRVLTFLGDGFLVAFPTPAEGVLAALTLQSALIADPDLKVRIGVESGEVIRLGADDYVGLCLHTASRLCDLSDGGQALFGNSCLDAAKRVAHLPPLECSLVSIRGLDHPVLAFLSEAPALPISA